jgi:hypothetical protein
VEWWWECWWVGGSSGVAVGRIRNRTSEPPGFLLCFSFGRFLLGSGWVRHQPLMGGGNYDE